jgi:molecular chaperone HtpG
MTSDRVPVGINFRRVLETISAQIYDTPMAFLRENVQNAVDALRMYRAEMPKRGDALSIEIIVSGNTVKIIDSGIGMNRTELQSLFWTMGASGKNTPLARSAGCVGHFGVGGFANFGVCRTLKVTSKRLDENGWESMVSIDEIPPSGVPEVIYTRSEAAAPHGTIIWAELTSVPKVEELRAYISSFVRFVPEPVSFNGTVISQKPMSPQDDIAYGASRAVTIDGTHFNASLGFDAEKTPILRLTSQNNSGGIGGVLRLSTGTLEVFKRGFKLCSIAVSSTFGVRGRLQSDALQPTAGRDSLSAKSQQFVQALVQKLELMVARHILTQTELIAANPRVIQVAVSHFGIESIGQMPLKLGNGDETTLHAIRDQFVEKKAQVYFGRAGDRDVLQILQASGNVIVPLSGDWNWQSAQRSYLTSLCGAKSFEGLIQIKERYSDLTTFELAFLAELEAAVRDRYEVFDFQLVPAAITGGIPAFARSGPGRLTINVDVRHQEIAKLERMGISPMLYSMATEFCREYLSAVLKSKSPKFFGSGALNVDEIMKRRAELWKIEAGDIAVDPRGKAPREGARGGHFGGVGIPQLVTSASIAQVEVGASSTNEPAAQVASPTKEQKILRVVDLTGKMGVEGYYFRIMDAPAKTFGNEIQTMTEVFAFWFGNRVTYVFSDGMRTAFHYELRLNSFVRVDGDAGGTIRLTKPIQEFGNAMFVEIPKTLEAFIVPAPGRDIFVTVNYDWIDLQRGETMLSDDSALAN